MNSNDKHDAGDGGYCTPSFAADLFATLVGLALVYGMISLIGNGLAQGKGEEGGRAVHAAVSRHRTEAAYPTIDSTRLERLRKGSLAAFALHREPKELPAFTYVDEKGKSHSLKELRGKVVLLNLWATWCGPCRHEMAWLDELQKKYGGDDFKMLTISVDRGGLAKPRRFFNQINVKFLTLYGDPTGRLAPTLHAFGMPTTLLIDRNGREVGRINGPAEWNSKEALAFVEAAIDGARDKLN